MLRPLPLGVRLHRLKPRANRHLGVGGTVEQLLEGGCEMGFQLPHPRPHQVRFIAEVQIEIRPATARVLGDLIHAGVPVALPGEQLEGGVDELLPGVRGLLLMQIYDVSSVGVAFNLAAATGCVVNGGVLAGAF